MRGPNTLHLIAQSFCGWPVAREGGPVKTEEDPLDPNPPSSFGKILAAIRYLEDTVQRTSDLEALALRYGFFIVDNEPAPVSVWLPALADAVGAKPPFMVPAWLGKLVIGDGGVSMMTRVRGGSNAKAKRELGWQPIYSSWRRGFVEGLDQGLPRLTQREMQL
jgi:hypothetical protein